MRIEELRYSENVTDRMRTEISDLVGRAQSLEHLLREWFRVADRSACVCRGIDDEDPKKLSVCVVLKANRAEVVELYLPDCEVLPEGSKQITLDEFVTESKRTKGAIQVDDKKLDAWEAFLGFEYNEFLCEQLGPWEALMPLTLAYVFSKGGQVDISTPHPDLLEDFMHEEDALDLDSLLCVDVSYHVPREGGKFVSGFGSSVYVWREGVTTGSEMKRGEGVESFTEV